MARPETAAVRLLTGEREPVRVATTANIELSGLQTIDGVTVEAGDRVLVKDQTDATQNGIYTAAAGSWYRSSDARSARAIQKGVTVHVQQGDTQETFVYSFQTFEPNIGEDDIVLSFFQSDDTVAVINNAVAAGVVTVQEAADDTIAAVREWADNDEDVLVSAAAGGDEVDDYSAKHWAEKSKDFGAEWSSNAEDAPVSEEAGGDGSTTFSAFHWSEKARAAASEAAAVVAENLSYNAIPFTKTFDGVDDTITLPASVASADAVEIYIGESVRQKPGEAYTVSGDTVTLNFVPDDGVVAWGYVKILNEFEIGVPDPESVGADEIKGSDKAAIRTKLEVYSEAEVDAALAALVPPAGAVLQSVSGSYTANAEITGAGGVIPYDDTIPQITEGQQIISVVITPISATNKLRVRFTGQAAGDQASSAISAAMFIDGQSDAFAADSGPSASCKLAFEGEIVPGNTVARTITLRVGVPSSSHKMRLNGTVTARRFGGASVARLVVEEVKV